MTQEPQNIQNFKMMAGRILGELYSEHPAELQADASMFFGNTIPEDSEVDLFDDTMNYLVRSGFIHRDKHLYVQLTSASWEVLQKPDPLAKETSLGISLATWGKKLGSDFAADELKKIAPEALSALYAAMKARGAPLP